MWPRRSLAKVCPFPSAKRARDDGHASPSMQAVVFDSVADESVFVKVELMLGYLRRSLLPASTANVDNGATSLMHGHVKLQRYSHEIVTPCFVCELGALPVRVPFCLEMEMCRIQSCALVSPCLFQTNTWLSSGVLGSWRHFPFCSHGCLKT